LEELELFLSLQEQPQDDMPKTRRRSPLPDYTQTSWWRLIHHPDIRDVNSRQHGYFRLPYSLFERLVDLIYANNWFPGHSRNNNPRSCNAAPLELKVLGVLRILGRGGPFDDLFDGSGISENTHRTFFIKFCQRFVEDFYDEYIREPAGDDLTQVVDIYLQMGFPGCVGSVDCVHVWWDMCAFQLKSACTGKEKLPTLAYEVTCDHHKKIRAVTPSHLGAILCVLMSL